MSNGRHGGENGWNPAHSQATLQNRKALGTQQQDGRLVSEEDMAAWDKEWEGGSDRMGSLILEWHR